MARYFHGPGCEIVDHRAGDRHWEIGCCDQEWTGSVWTLVCTACDLPMSDRDGQGWLCCAVCGLSSRDVPRRIVPPAAVA